MVIARSAGFVSKAACRASIDFLQRAVETAQFLDETEPPAKTAVAKKTAANKGARSGARSTKKRT
jgi:hypothetical protein